MAERTGDGYGGRASPPHGRWRAGGFFRRQAGDAAPAPRPSAAWPWRGSRLAWLALALLLLLPSRLAGAADAAPAPAAPALDAPARPLTFGVLAPFAYGGQAVGGGATPEDFDAEALGALGKALGVEIRLRRGKLSDLAAALEKGEIDAIGGAAVTADWSQRYRFALPHREVRAVCLNLADGSPIVALRDTFGKKVAVVRQTPVAAMLRDSGWLDKCDVVFCAGATDALDMVMERRVECAWLSRAQALALEEEFKFYGRKLRTSEPLLTAPYACAVRQDDAALAERLDRGWLRLRLNGELDQLNRKWFNAVAPRPVLRIAVPDTASGANDRVLGEMGRRLGFQTEIVPVPVLDTLRNLPGPERGLAATLVVNELAEKLVPDWERLAPVGQATGVRAKVVVFSPVNGKVGGNAASLCGARVGINRQFSCLEPAVESLAGGKIDWVRMADDDDRERMLLAGRVAAYVVPEELASPPPAPPGLRRLVLLDCAEKVIFHRDQLALADACGQALAQMRQDGTLATILLGQNPHSDGHKRVIFVHSFGGDFSPFYETGRHIVREFSRASPLPLIEHEYLENGVRPFSQDDERRLSARLRGVHGSHHCDLVIAEDFPALAFVHRHHEQLFYKAPVYAYGVGGDLGKVLAEAPEVTGMVEEISAAATFQLIRQLHPDAKRLYVINDHSPSGQAVRDAIERQIAASARAAGWTVEYSPNVPQQELLARLASLQPRHTVGLLGFYTTDVATGQTVDREVFRPLLEKWPVYGVFDRYQRVGQIGGKLVTPSDPGDACMAAINLLLAGVAPDAVPEFDSSGGNRWVFSGAALRRHGLSSAALPEGAEVARDAAPERPAWGLRTSQALMAAFALLILLVAILLWLVARSRNPAADGLPASRRPSLGRWRVLALAAMLTLPLALFYQMAASQVMEQARANLRDGARRAAELMHAKHEATRAVLLGFFRLQLSSAPDAPEDDKREGLRAFVKRVGGVEGAWLRPDGSGFASDGELADLADEEFVLSALANGASLSPLRYRGLGRPAAAPRGGAAADDGLGSPNVPDLLVTAVAVPVSGEDRHAGVAMLARSYQSLADVFDTTLFGEKTRVALLDGNGRAVVSARNGAPETKDAGETDQLLLDPEGLTPALSAIGAQKAETVELWFDGAPHVFGVCPVPDTEWKALVGVPAAALSARLLPLRALAAALAVALLVGLTVPLWRARRLQALAQTASLTLRRDRDDLAARNALLERETRDLAKQAESERDANRGHGQRLEELRRRLMGLLEDGSGLPVTAWGGHADLDGVCHALADRLAWYRSLIDNTVVPMVVLDEHKNLLFGNAAWRQMESQVPVEMFARAYDAFPADGGYTLAAGEEAEPTAALTHAPGRDPKSLRFHDPEHDRWLQMRVAWIVNRAGERRGCIVSAEDVTLAHDHETILRLLVDNLPIGCVFHNLNTMDVSYANPAVLRLLAVDNPAEYGLRWREYFAPVQPGGLGALDVHQEILARLRRDGAAGGDIVCRSGRGEDIPCRLRGVVCGEHAVFFVSDLRGGPAAGADGVAGEPGGADAAGGPDDHGNAGAPGAGR